jgi:hypothetical protein
LSSLGATVNLNHFAYRISCRRRNPRLRKNPIRYEAMGYSEHPGNESLRGHRPLGVSYPFTLILENDKTARLDVGRPIDKAGRNVVKISMRFTCGSTSFDTSGSERMR